MNMSDERSWWPIPDDTNVIPGYEVPADHPTPYWSETLVSERECDEFYYEVIAQYSMKQLARVYQWDGGGDEINVDSRYTHYYDINAFRGAFSLAAKFNRAVENMAATWWQQGATPVYTPQILGYEERCKFATHCDNSIWVHNQWQRNDTTRDVTGLLYISDCVDTVTAPNQHQGGELNFPNIQTRTGGTATVRPAKGLFVAFPSHPVYRHQVYPVVRGYRVALVNWWTIR